MNILERNIKSFKVEDSKKLVDQILQWSKQFDLFSFLNSNAHSTMYSQDEFLVGAGGKVVEAGAEPFEDLNSYHNQIGDWLFGCLSYDLKNGIEKLESQNKDGIDFPDLLFFRPEVVLKYDREFLRIEVLEGDPKTVFEEITKQLVHHSTAHQSIKLKARYTKEEYVSKIKKLKEHIQFGDIYEINFCQEFYAEDTELNPEDIYHRLNSQTKAPFSAYFKADQWFVFSGSPERYLAKRDTRLISQPIKGTARRSKNKEEDILIKQTLLNSPKERAENVMIVDLVRNDLSITAIKNSVEVEELFGLYSFPTVHQLISTIVSEIEDKAHWGSTLRNTFPMGSMTGAPKVSAMQLIEKYEDFKRGIFSGAIGYISPSGDFDFNVVIRSIIYNSELRYVSVPVGGAITIQSDPELEYEECLLKVQAMIAALK